MIHESSVVLVTGGTRGIGRATAERLVSEGCQVIITSRTDEQASELAQLLTSKYGVVVSGLPLDQSQPSSVNQLIKTIFEKFGRLDGLVLNAGIHDVGRIGMISEDSLQILLQTNSVGTFRMIQSGVKLLRKSNSPSIVLVGSIMASSGIIGQTAYAMSKASLSGILTPASRELALHGIRINMISPGYVDTEMVQSLSRDQREEIINRTPLGRFATAEEIASLISFLISSESSFITGENIRIDGGLRG